MLSLRLLQGLSAVHGPFAQLLAARGYHANVVDHFERPRNVGSMKKDDPDVGTGLVGAPACGDVMKLQIKVCTALVWPREPGCFHAPHSSGSGGVHAWPLQQCR